VEHTVVDHYIDQADPAMVTPEAYNIWTKQPLEERVQEIEAYLSAQEADLLALNYLEGNREGSIMSFILKNLNVTILRVTGEAPYVLGASRDPAVSDRLTEGVLAAMYLLREHQIGQAIHDADVSLAPPIVSPQPPEAPPGHYLG
jgi:hypothetical protein